MGDSSNGILRNSAVGEYARIGDLDKLKEAITNGAPVDIPDDQGFYPIHLAASENHCECLKVLLQHEKTNVNWCTCTHAHPFDGEKTALTIAAGNGCVECVRVLLENGAKVNLCAVNGVSPVNFRPANGLSPLMAATMYYSTDEDEPTDCVDVLINAGADVSQKSLFGRTPLHEAVRRGFYDIVRLLLSSGADPLAKDDRRRTPISTACNSGDDMCLQILLGAVDDKQAAVNHRSSRGESCVYVACRKGSESCLKILLENGADVNLCTDNGTHPILAADNHVGTGCARLILPLVDKNVVFYSKADPISSAAYTDNLEMLKLLIEDGYPVNRSSDWRWDTYIESELRDSYPIFAKPMTTPLGVAVRRSRKSYLGIMRVLLDAGAEMQPKDAEAMSPFLLAITNLDTSWDNRDMSQILGEFLKRDVDLNFIDPITAVEIPDAFLVAAYLLYRPHLLLMLKAGLKPCLEHWCGTKLQQCSGTNLDPQSSSFLRKISQAVTSEELEELVRVVLPFSRNGLPNCCDAWSTAFGGQLPDFGAWQDKLPSLQHLCRVTIRDQLSTKQLYTRDWIEKITLPERLKDYLIFKDN